MSDGLAPLDPAPLLETLERYSKPSLKEEANGGRSVWGWILAVLAALAATMVTSWILFRHQRELARLRHEKNKKLILRKQADAAAAAARSDAQAAEAAKKIELIDRELGLLKSEKKRIELKHEANRAALSRVTSFSQFSFGGSAEGDAN